MKKIKIVEKSELYELEEELNLEIKELLKNQNTSNIDISAKFFNNDFDDLEKCIGTITYDECERKTNYNLDIEIIIIQDFYLRSFEQRVNELIKEKSKNKKSRLKIETQFISDKDGTINNYFGTIIIYKKSI